MRNKQSRQIIKELIICGKNALRTEIISDDAVEYLRSYENILKKRAQKYLLLVHELLRLGFMRLLVF